MQSLPLPESSVSSKPILNMDDIAVVPVKVWPIQMPTWNGVNGLWGPVPTIYTEQPEELRSLLEREAHPFACELNKFMSR